MILVDIRNGIAIKYENTEKGLKLSNVDDAYIGIVKGKTSEDFHGPEDMFNAFIKQEKERIKKG